MKWKQLAATLAALAWTVVISGCMRSVFVGIPAAPPEQIILAPGPDSPVPPFGQIPRLVLDEGPGEPPAVLLSEEVRSAEPAFAWTETENILVMGTDRRPHDATWRTDTIMVVGLDRARKRAAVLSVPRDLYLEIPDYGYGRINQVDYIGERVTRVKGGGPALMSSVLSETLGIATEHWVRFELTGFETIVDAVGGVTVSLDCPFYEPIFNLDTNSWDYFSLPAGEVHMDGETANWFVRLRLTESDIGRANRQRQFLWALREQALSTNLLRQFPALWRAFSDSFATDLSLLDMVELIQYGIGLDASNVRASGFTLKDLQSHITSSGASVLIITDPAKVRQVVDGIWDAPPMIDSNRKDSSRCPPAPAGVPMVALDIGTPAQPLTETVQTSETISPAVEVESSTAGGS